MPQNQPDESPEPSGPDDAKPGERRSPLRLPVLSGGEERGLGDAVKRATAAMHIRTCGGCERRAQALNRWVVFAPRGRRN
jgi:hypothetical protein